MHILVISQNNSQISKTVRSIASKHYSIILAHSHSQAVNMLSQDFRITLVLFDTKFNFPAFATMLREMGVETDIILIGNECTTDEAISCLPNNTVCHAPSQSNCNLEKNLITNIIKNLIPRYDHSIKALDMTLPSPGQAHLVYTRPSLCNLPLQYIQSKVAYHLSADCSSSAHRASLKSLLYQNNNISIIIKNADTRHTSFLHELLSNIKSSYGHRILILSHNIRLHIESCSNSYHITQLNQWGQDILHVLRHFVQNGAQFLNHNSIPHLSHNAQQHLISHTWHGEIFELEYIAQQYVSLCNSCNVAIAEQTILKQLQLNKTTKLKIVSLKQSISSKIIFAFTNALRNHMKSYKDDIV